MFCLDALACASIAVDAWLSICGSASCVVSIAKSASSMPPLAADRLDEMLVELLTVWCRRFDIAPKSALMLAAVVNALSTKSIAFIASSGGLTAVPVADSYNKSKVPPFISISASKTEADWARI